MAYVIFCLLILFLVAYNKLRNSNSDLKEQLERLEKRIDLLSSKSETKAKAGSNINLKVPQTSGPIEEEIFTAAEKKLKASIPKPPPLPPVTVVASTAKPTTSKPVLAEPVAAKKKSSAAPAPTSDSPSFLERIPWRNILERLHLWPPSKSETGESAEVQLASWWTIRAGLVIGIIGAVFAGVYVSQRTPPSLRVLALFLVSCGTITLGAKMKDKLEGFGRAIIGGGFALLFFTAFASFALPATKVIDSPTIGIFAQLAALIASIVWSLWKKDQMVATLTLVLGFVSCGFSHNHDLDRFTLIGLVFLAATGSFLFARRGWLTSFITSLSGSWIAYAVFALLDLRNGDTPGFPILLGTLIALTILFEAGNLVGIARRIHPLKDRWRRFLILSNTSAAAILGYGVTRLTYPDELSTFYFVFALLYFAFTAIHYFRDTDEVLTETLLLKTSALLCLGFAAAFDGPVRWLAIAFQSFALLWTARRSNSRWIALGFAVVFTVSLGWFWHDLIADQPEQWQWFETFRIAGSFYLVFLTAQLTLHSRWFVSGIGGITEDHQKQAHAARLLGAFAISLSAIAFAMNPSSRGSSEPQWFLLILSTAMATVSPAMRSALPCFAASLPLLFTYLSYASLSRQTSQSTGALFLGATLIALAFGIAELIRHFWPRKINGAPTSRGLVLLAGLFTLLPFTYALANMLSISSNAAIGVFVLIPLVATAALFSRHQLIKDGTRSRALSGFYLTTGIIVFFGGLNICQRSDYFSSALILSSLPLFFTLFRIRSSRAALAGVIPLLGGFLFLWIRLLKNQPNEITHDSVNLTIALVVSIGLAIVLWKKITSPSLLKLASYSDVALHGLAIFSIHLFFQKHLAEGSDFFASALLGITLLFISRRFPFRSLAIISWLPITLALFTGLLNGSWLGTSTGHLGFWLAGLITLLHLLLSDHWIKKGAQAGSAFLTDTHQFRFQPLISAIVVGTWTLLVLAAASSPWQASGLTAVTLLCTTLWRWRKVEAIAASGLVPLILSALISIPILASAKPMGTPTQDLLSVILVAIGFASNGVILGTTRQGHKWLTSTSISPWLHAGVALLIAFTAFATDRLVSENFTSVFWGLTAIILFVSGLFAGLRPYRLMGLIGLLFCILHIFIWDIQDNLHRIFAFFAIGLVLLVIGFLYHKFRDRITALES